MLFNSCLTAIFYLTSVHCSSIGFNFLPIVSSILPSNPSFRCTAYNLELTLTFLQKISVLISEYINRNSINILIFSIYIGSSSLSLNGRKYERTRSSVTSSIRFGFHFGLFSLKILRESSRLEKNTFFKGISHILYR